MKVNHYEAVPQKPVDMEGIAPGCTVRQLLGQAEGTPTFAMRQFEVAAGATRPVTATITNTKFSCSSNGEVFENNTPHKLSAGDVVLVKPNEVHQFRNTGAQPMKFLCRKFQIPPRAKP